MTGKVQRGSQRHRSRGGAERQLRIIAGQWRGRRLKFPDETIRPTPDRVRETLFNWLASRIEGARCLDLFAGSGALGLEALSRGASQVLFVEQRRASAQALSALLADWGAAGASVLTGDALSYLGRARGEQRFDVVFLDPPFDAGLCAPAAAALARGWLAPGARVYVEYPRAVPPALPADWTALRSGTAGEVGYDLYVQGTHGLSSP